jgi:hypothetical protein
MNRRLKIAIAFLLLLIVAAVLISPAVDLEPTALRALIWSAAMLASIAAAIAVFSGIRLTFVRGTVLTLLLRGTPSSIPLTDLGCVRLC